ncbi:MAG: DUF6414 family protein [Solirubrobacteraceae bacterium]
MSLSTRWRRWRRKRSAAQTRGRPLREFVYLDDTSVLSLLASRIGAVPTEYTDSESRALSTGVNSKLGASAAVLKAEAGSSIETSRSTATQVIRMSSIQSAFKELLEYAEDSLALQWPRATPRPPRVRTLRDLAAQAEGTDRHWVTSPSELRRGELIEVEVSLDADEIFRFSVILTTLLRFVDQIPELANVTDGQSLKDALTANQILDQMLAGLVPLRGEVVDYRLVTVEGKQLVVHTDLLEQLDEAVVDVHPLQVVAVAEADLFWRDIRRVLFSGARYTVLARLSRAGIQTEWMPVKLVELLKDFVPDLAANFDGRGLLDAIKRAQAETPTHLAIGNEQVLLSYGELLGERYGVAVDTTALTLELHATLPQPTPFETIPQQRTAFAAVTEWIRSQGDVPDEPDVLAELRETAMVREAIFSTELEPGDSSIDADGSASVADGGTGDNPAPMMLDTEVVAIYW